MNYFPNIFFAVIISFVATTNSVYPQENEAEQNKEVTNDKEEKTVKPTVNKRSRIKTLEEFIPSEEVSADKPVAFPSDI